MEQNLIRQIRVLQIYAIFLTIVIAVLITLFFQQNAQSNPNDKKQHFKELDAERINIIDSNGSLRMVISNPKRQDPGAFSGKKLEARERPAGMIFFNDDGDECGGLVYDGNKKEASFTYSVDQYKNDQIMQWQYDQDNSTQQRVRSYGLKMWDRRDDFGLTDIERAVDSLKDLHDTAAYAAGIKKLRAEGAFSTERLFLGKTRARQVGLFIRDNKGRPRIEIGLDSSNNMVLHAFDSSGRIIPFK